MTIRSGVYTKYALTFPGLDNLKISNDPAFGTYALDGEVDIKMAYGPTGTTFTIVIYDLVSEPLKSLKEAKGIAAKSVKIELGYFETDASLVINGVFDKVTAAAGKSPNDNRLATTITGQEAALFACSTIKFRSSVSSAGASSYADVANTVLSEVFSDCSKQSSPGIDSLLANKVQSDATQSASLKTSVSFPKGSSVLKALSDIAWWAKQELLLIDGKVFLGSPVSLKLDAAQLDPQLNLAAYDEQKQKITARANGSGAAPEPKEIQSFNFTALGDPSLRPGQPVTVSNVGTLPASSKFVIRNLEHLFNAKGYTCIGAAAELQPDGALGQAIDAAIKPSADTAAQQIKGASSTGPAIEVAEVMQAGADPYKMDLFHATLDDSDPELQPSIHTEIKQDGKQIYENKPIASPFAWRKCGLVTPYYRGMKALVAHNSGLASDLIVTGYIWSDTPDTPPPASKEGDWWLCLPIDLKDAPPAPPPPPPKPCDPAPVQAKTPFKAPPDDNTKAVNDLTSAAGLRVIEVKGLRITVGADKLKTVGGRPADATADELLIEHASGTTLHIDSQGALTITSKGALTLDVSNSSMSIKGDVKIQGSLEIT